MLVGLSGGVDSSVAAYLLKQKGYEAIGVTMTLWGDRPVPKNHKCSKDACFSPNEQEDVEAARRIAQKLDIPHYVFDCSKNYEDIVLRNFKDEYLNGRTPNPCVRCNAFIKFGILPLLAKKNGIVFDKFATGHYARIEKTDGRYILKRAVNDTKDQSYFLYRLTEEKLADILFPLGDLTKNEVRIIARDAGLHTADKKDSQDFYSGDYGELLNLDRKEGNIIDKDGEVLGIHYGFWNYTTGQRKGINIQSGKYSGKPLYVLELRHDTNEIVVGDIDETFKKSLVASELNWIGIKQPVKEFFAQAKIRSTSKPVCVKIIPEGENMRVLFDEYQKSIACGQSVVFYQDDTLLGGGIIQSVQ